MRELALVVRPWDEAEISCSHYIWSVGLDHLVLGTRNGNTELATRNWQFYGHFDNTLWLHRPINLFLSFCCCCEFFFFLNLYPTHISVSYFDMKIGVFEQFGKIELIISGTFFFFWILHNIRFSHSRLNGSIIFAYSLFSFKNEPYKNIIGFDNWNRKRLGAPLRSQAL